MSDFYRPIDSRLSQCDLLLTATHACVTLAEGTTDPVAPVNLKSSMGIIITNDCMLDKPKTVALQICPVVPVSRFPPGQLNDIRRNKLYQYFHLPHEEGVPESVVDFAVVTTIDKAAAENAVRICTLSDLGRQGFFAQLIRHLTRWELRSVECPACGAEFDLSMSMEVRADD